MECITKTELAGEKEKQTRSKHDSPWKAFIQRFFKDLIKFFLPDFYEAIDWSKPCEFLDAELLGIQAAVDIGDKIADKLVKVFTQNNEEKWILLHVEVQGKGQSDFSLRMYEYYCRIFLIHQKPIFSIAILTDKSKRWRPQPIKFDFGHRSTIWEYDTIKLIDYKNDPILKTSNNPVAKLVEIHLAALSRYGSVELRFEHKLRLMKNIYELGYTNQDVILWYLIIDFIFTLKKSMQKKFNKTIFEYEKENQMNYVSSMQLWGEEIGLEKGLEKGQRRLILKLLENKFGKLSKKYQVRLDAISSNELEKIACNLLTATTPDELFNDI